MSASKHALAKRARDRKLAQLTEIYDACACEFPLTRYRNRHGHGNTHDGRPCPAITVIERLRAEREELRALLEES